MSPYYIGEPCGISFSGGRSSGYMLHKILEAQGGLLPGQRVIFANTGKEMPETLDFVHRCSQEWGVDITWIEYDGEKYPGVVYDKGKHKGKQIREGKYREVSYETASRNGEPFMRLIKERGMAPNLVARFCTVALKIRGIHTMAPGNLQVIGIRGDEKRRALKLHGQVSDGRESYCPMWLAKVTKEDVKKFWDSQSFDLGLPNNDGTTDWGNCDLCYLKARSKRVSLVQQRPDLVQWWIDAEEAVAPSVFRKGDSYRLIASDAASTAPLGFSIDETIPCFCGD